MALHYPNTNVPFPSVHKGKDQERDPFHSIWKIAILLIFPIFQGSDITEREGSLRWKRKAQREGMNGKSSFKKIGITLAINFSCPLKVPFIMDPWRLPRLNTIQVVSESFFFCCAQFDEQHRNAFCDAVSGGFFFFFLYPPWFASSANCQSRLPILLQWII